MTNTNTQEVALATIEPKPAQGNKSILTPDEIYIPRHEKLVEIMEEHERAHWVVDEIDMRVDTEQWKNGTLSDSEKTFIKMILRLFTQADTDVCAAYVNKLLPTYNQTDIRLMLLSFAARECFDDKTEVLTNEGWKFFKDLTKTELIAQFDTNTYEISYSKPEGYVEKAYEGKMHLYEASRTSICVTPNHRLITIHPSSKKLTFNESHSGLWGSNYQYPGAGYGIGQEDTLSDLERLFIAIQADGAPRKNCPSRSMYNAMTCDFTLSKSRKIERLTHLLEKVGANLNPRLLENGQTRFTFALPVGSVDPVLLKNFGWVDPVVMSRNKARAFIEELLFWDGSTGTSNSSWFNTNEEAVDKVQQIAILAGFITNKGVNRHAGEYQVLDNPKESVTKTCYVVGFSDSLNKTYPYRKEIEYKGKVYCVTMPKGTVVTRRFGKIAIQGNCTHMRGYRHLNTTLGYDSEEFMSEFLGYAEMKSKHEFMIEDQDRSTPTGRITYLAKQILMEGVNLFASFAMLLSFSQEGKLPGMVDVNKWSIADESYHVSGLTELFKLDVSENPKVVNNEFKANIYETARQVVALEDAFIDLCYSVGHTTAVKPEQLKAYIRYVCDYRMKQMGFKTQFGIKENPIEWIDLITGNTFGNFFETTVVQYSKASLTGEWEY